MATIPNIKIGKSVRDREVFDLSHDVSTTAHWGFVQPLFCREMIPNETLTVSVDSFVRTSPLVRPTMARITYNTYHQFVPISTICESFEAFLAQEGFSRSNGVSYVPESVPNTTINELSRLIFNMGECTIYQLTGYTVQGQREQWTSASIVTGSTAEVLLSNYSFPTYMPIYGGVSKPTLTVRDENRVSVGNNDGAFHFTKDNVHYLACFRLPRSAKNLRTILIGLGYQLSIGNFVGVSLLPLMAFYKAYFDIFYVQKNFSWEDTFCHRLSVFMVENNVYTPNLTNQVNYDLFIGFLNELKNTYYSENPNYVSMAQSSIADIKLRTQPSMVDNANNQTTAPFGWTATTNLPFISPSTNLDKTRMDLLNKLTTMVNKNTQIGGRVKDYLKVHYGADFMLLDNSNYIGSDVMNVNVSDVVASSASEGQPLGDTAGKGTGYGEGKKLKYSTDTFGYWITLGCIVPKGNFCQGVSKMNEHITRYGFYTPEFDALGYQVVKKGEVLGTHHHYQSNFDSDLSSSFGLAPRFAEYKTHSNILNGDLSLLSTKNDMLPYTLDKFIEGSDLVLTGTDASRDLDLQSAYITHMNPSTLVAGTTWRYVGQNGDINNFNRIFSLENAPYDFNPDNFIIHNVFDVKAVSPMISLSKSFDTYDKDIDNGSIDIEKV